MSDVLSKEEKTKYKKDLEIVYFNLINAFIPKYITIGNSEEFFYEKINESLKVIFQKDYNEIDKNSFLNKVEFFFKKFKYELKNSFISQEYIDILEMKILDLTNKCLYADPYYFLLNYYEKENKKYEQRKDEGVLYSYYKERKEKEKQNKDINFINLVKLQLQELTENFGIEIIVANNIKWPEIKEWTDNMNIILINLFNKMELPHKSIVNKKLTIICNKEYNSIDGLFINHENGKEFINITLNSLISMSHTFIHEYTHYLDYKAGQIYGGNLESKNNEYLSEYIVFKKLKMENESNVLLIKNMENFIYKTLGITENNRNETQIKINNLKDKFYINLFEEIGIKYDNLPIEMGYLHNDNYNFLNRILSMMYDCSREETSFVSKFDSPLLKLGKLKLSSNIMNFYKKMNLSVDQSLLLVEVLKQPEFIDKFFLEVRQFFLENGIIKYNNIDKPIFIKSDSTFIKNSLTSLQPAYWTNLKEILARVVEDIEIHPTKVMIEPKKKFFDRFRKIGATIITEKLYYHHDSIKLLYPNREIYDLTFNNTIKTAFQSMFHYIKNNLEEKQYKKRNTIF